MSERLISVDDYDRLRHERDEWRRRYEDAARMIEGQIEAAESRVAEIAESAARHTAMHRRAQAAEGAVRKLTQMLQSSQAAERLLDPMAVSDAEVSEAIRREGGDPAAVGAAGENLIAELLVRRGRA